MNRSESQNGETVCVTVCVFLNREGCPVPLCCHVTVDPHKWPHRPQQSLSYRISTQAPKPTLETRYPGVQRRQQRPQKDASVCVSVFQIRIDHLLVRYSERGPLDLKYWSIGGHAHPTTTSLTLWPGLRRSLFAATRNFDRGKCQSIKSSSFDAK